MDLSWKLTTNTNDQNTLFTGSEYVYDIDLFVCSCGHIEHIIRNKTDVVEYTCIECENKNFYSVNEALYSIDFFLGNIKNIDKFLTLEIEENGDYISSVCYFNMPYSYDFISEKIKYKRLDVYKLSVGNDGRIFKKYLNKPSYVLSTKITRSLYPYIIERRDLNKFELLVERTLNNINNEFRENFYLRDFELLSWKSPKLRCQSVLDSLDYILHNRKEKSVKKALYTSYEYLMKNEKYYSPIYNYIFCKHIKDPNILTKLITLQLNNPIEVYDDSYNLKADDESFEIFILFLKKFYSEKQILNILNSEDRYNYYLTDTINEVVFYIENNLDTFNKTKSNIKSVHDGILKANQKLRYRHVFDVTFKYSKKIIQRCIENDGYKVYLPENGEELYIFAEELSNCMAGYSDDIYRSVTTIYIFFKNNKVKFAVEVSNDTLIQASTKYNGILESEDRKALKNWMGEFNIKGNEQYRSIYDVYES